MSQPPISKNNHLIYIPEEALPLVAHQSHRYARSILDSNFTFIQLPPLSGFTFLLYFPPANPAQRQNNFICNIYRGARYNAAVYGPALAVVLNAADQSIVQPEALHLQLLQDAIYHEASSRAAILSLRQ